MAMAVDSSIWALGMICEHQVDGRVLGGKARAKLETSTKQLGNPWDSLARHRHFLVVSLVQHMGIHDGISSG